MHRSRAACSSPIRPTRHRGPGAPPRDLLADPPRDHPGAHLLALSVGETSRADPSPVVWSLGPPRRLRTRAPKFRPSRISGDMSGGRPNVIDTRRTCQSCPNPIPPDARSDSRTCSPRCRQALHRAEKVAQKRAEREAKSRADSAVLAARPPAPVTSRDARRDEPPASPRPAAETISEQARSHWDPRYWNGGPQW